MEYKKFKDEQPEAGRLVEIRLSDQNSYFYSVLTWVNGIPQWSGNGMPRPEQEWRYSTIGEPVSPLGNSEATPVFTMPTEVMVPIKGYEYAVSFRPVAVGDSFTAVKTEDGWKYDFKDTEPASPVSPEQQAAWNNPPVTNPNPEIVFKESYGFLFGEDKNTSRCFELPNRVAYDALLKLAVSLDKGDATPASNDTQINVKTFEVIATPETSEKILGILNNRIKDLEGALRIKDQAIDSRNETNDFLAKEIQARDHVIELKDKKISYLMIESAKYGLAAIEESEEA